MMDVTGIITSNTIAQSVENEFCIIDMKTPVIGAEPFTTGESANRKL